MSGGLAGLLDDVAALARLAAASTDDVAAGVAKASSKAVGVVVDDAAVTPQYVQGVDPSRELPMIRRIAVGSLRNKIVVILPVLLLLSQFAPWALTPILMLGGSYLVYEGAEKIWEFLRGQKKEQAAVEAGPDAENAVVKSAITTDFILSCEIMVISLNEVTDAPLLTRALILLGVALAITVLVYGAVALLVKMDDAGLALTRRDSEGSQRLGRGLVSAMPKVLDAISVIGTLAMLWVGGHIILVGLDELGWHAPYSFVHHLEEQVHHATGPLGGVLGWLTNTFFSMVLGLLWGAVIVAVLTMLGIGHGKGGHGESGHGESGHDTDSHTRTADRHTHALDGVEEPGGTPTSGAATGGATALGSAHGDGAGRR